MLTGMLNHNTTHDQDGCHAHVWLKALKIFFSRIEQPMILKFGIQHLVLKSYQIPSNDYAGLTFDRHTEKSHLLPYAFIREKT